MTSTHPHLTSPDAPIVAQEVFNLWNQGAQAQAFERLDASADRGEGWALSFRVFLRIQQGPDQFLAAAPDVHRCQDLGMPWVVGYYVNQIVSNLPYFVGQSPTTFESLEKLLAGGMYPWSPNWDLVSQGWNLLANNQSEMAVQLLGLHTEGPWPGNLSNEGWPQALSKVQRQSREMAEELAKARAGQASLQKLLDTVSGEIDTALSEFKTKADTAGVLVDEVSNKTAQHLFETSAAKNETEGKSAFKWGLAVLGAAATAAVLPLLIHYVGGGPDFSGPTLLAAHASVSLTLAALAGVLLARARTRDHARQRSQDLATAMGTTIDYSNQIQDPVEKQMFQIQMTRGILEAHLKADGGSTASTVPAAQTSLDASGLAALASALRGTNS